MPSILEKGVPLGVEEVIEFHPDVWLAARTKQFSEVLPLVPAERNYASFKEHETAVRKSYVALTKRGSAVGPLTESAAQAYCRSSVLYHGAIGANEELKTLSDGSRKVHKVRTVHDGTIIGLTQRST